MDGCLRLLLFLLPSIAFADGANNEWNSTTRALSMGNVGIASAEDSTTAMFYNPAALARAKNFMIEPFNPQIEVGSGVFNMGGLNVSKNISLKQVKPELEKHEGKPSYLGASMYPNISAHNFDFGVLMKGEGGSYYDGTKLYYRSRYLVIPTMGLSLGLLGGRFRLGVAGRAIQATDNNKVVTGLAGDDGYSLGAQEGFGLGLDAGALITIPAAGLPTLGLVARNVGDTTFSGSSVVRFADGDVQPHEKMKMTYDAGFSLSPRIDRKSEFVFAIDYRDILNQSELATLRRMNVGLELGMSKIFYLRAGVSRGYWTAGIGLASKYGSLDLGSYAEELDATGFRVKEDRRVSLRFGSRF